MSEPALPLTIDPRTIPEGLARKLTAIMQESGYLKQEGKNTAQNYSYLSEEQLVTKLRTLMNKHGVVMIPNVYRVEWQDIARKPWKGEQPPPFQMATVYVTYKIVDGDTGEYTTCGMIGSGIDGGDKHIYKAVTGANKYMLMKLFQIPSGNDPEKQGEWDQPDAPEPMVEPKKEKKTEPKKDARAEAFRNAANDLIVAAKDVSNTKEVDATVIRVLGSNGATKISEVTDSKARRAFIADLKEQLDGLDKE